MRIIDAHLHFADREGFKRTAQEISHIEYSAAGLTREFKEAGVEAGVVMKTAGHDPNQSAETDLQLEDGTVEGLWACVGINPVLLEKDRGMIESVEEELQDDKVTGIKIYAGYYPYYAYDEVYLPVYELAGKYNLPVAIHCGDTQSPQGLLKYAHPLTIDELAVAFPSIHFVICHLGDPWVMDTAELIAKNRNVYTDLSGLIAGNLHQIQEWRKSRLFLEHFQRALVYANCYDKVLFGTDWPLVPVGPYVSFIKDIIPAAHHDKVFFRNALAVYPKLAEQFIQASADGPH